LTCTIDFADGALSIMVRLMTRVKDMALVAVYMQKESGKMINLMVLVETTKEMTRDK